MTLPRLRVRELMFLVVYAALIGQAFVMTLVNGSSITVAFDVQEVLTLPPGTPDATVSDRFGRPTYIRSLKDGSLAWIYTYRLDDNSVLRPVPMAGAIDGEDADATPQRLGWQHFQGGGRPYLFGNPAPVFNTVALRFSSGKLVKAHLGLYELMLEESLVKSAPRSLAADSEGE